MIPSPCASEPAVATPCVGVCVMGCAGFCLGCARTIKEIAAWASLSHPARLAVMEKLPARKALPASDSSL